MPRPKFPSFGGPFPVEFIRRVNSEQRLYDEDPERYERQEREREELRQQEEEEMRRQEREFYERNNIH